MKGFRGFASHIFSDDHSLVMRCVAVVMLVVALVCCPVFQMASGLHPVVGGDSCPLSGTC